MALDKRIPYAHSGESAAPRERSLDVGELASALFEKVLIPTEPDFDAKTLFSLAADLAGRFQSQILLVDVVPHEPTLARNPEVLQERRAKLEKIANSLRAAGAVRVHTILLEGSPSIQIEQIARQQNVSLILMAESTDASQAHAWFGTLTQKLARRVNVPLMVVNPAGNAALKPVLCVVDFSEASRMALRYAIGLSREMMTNLTILHVVPEPVSYAPVEGPIWQTCASPRKSRTPDQVMHSAADPNMDKNRRVVAARDELDAFLLNFDLVGVNHQRLVASGSPALETLTVARDRRCGVIAVGSDQRSGFIHMMTQSTAETLAETAEVPVLIVRGQPERQSVLQAHAETSEALPIQ